MKPGLIKKHVHSSFSYQNLSFQQSLLSADFEAQYAPAAGNPL